MPFSYLDGKPILFINSSIVFIPFIEGIGYRFSSPNRKWSLE